MIFQDAFGSERRKAKMLNFSIAYGKTTVGLARDWKVINSFSRSFTSLKSFVPCLNTISVPSGFS